MQAPAPPKLGSSEEDTALTGFSSTVCPDEFSPNRSPKSGFDVVLVVVEVVVVVVVVVVGGGGGVVVVVMFGAPV